MTQDVIFRRYRNAGEVIAVFPDIASDLHSWAAYCMSYRPNAGWEPCLVTICEHTRPAKKEEYAALKAGLEKSGHKLNIIGMFRERHLQARKMQAERGAYAAV